MITVVSKSFLRFLRRKLASPLQRRGSIRLQRYPPADKLEAQTLVVDVEGALLRSSSFFPYFMLVALEAGGLLRGLVLLLLYPLLLGLSVEAALKVMVMVSLCGIRAKGFRAGRAVLPKFMLEDVGLEGFEVMRKAKRRVGVSRLPRVMVEPFLKEYLGVESVVAREMKVVGGFYTGLMEESNSKELGFSVKELEADESVIGFGSYPTFRGTLQRQCFSLCKDVYMVHEAEKSNWHPLPRDKYPQPLVFHDGRLAFRPIPATTLAMFIWLPFAVPLAIFRCLVFILLPHRISLLIIGLTGMKSRFTSPPQSSGNHLYVCNHRTLLDPVYVSVAVNRPVTAVTYSVSRVSELISPIRTARLTRNKEADRRRMEELLGQGDLVVCPEGTTCREPFMLRFSPLFAELTDEIIPVALVSTVQMYYGTTASGFKCLDPLFFLMNPRPEYRVELLDRILVSGAKRSSIEVANHVQSEIGRRLGFECTALTRKDKYLILAGNDGVVGAEHKSQ